MNSTVYLYIDKKFSLKSVWTNEKKISECVFHSHTANLFVKKIVKNDSIIVKPLCDGSLM